MSPSVRCADSATNRTSNRENAKRRKMLLWQVDGILQYLDIRSPSLYFLLQLPAEKGDQDSFITISLSLLRNHREYI